jgi:glycosyltransferase involved in cell wall biosynthesis
MTKVSIILPVYNAGVRLFECLYTLTNQTLREIEIICVLDCPTDGSDKVVEKFAATDGRIKLVYNETNLHIAESRNKGLALAQGEYIGFSDHDDTRSLDMYEKLYCESQKCKSDIVFSNSYIKTDKLFQKVIYRNPTIEGIISSIILPMEHEMNANYLSKSVWGSIYKREFLQKNRIYFLNKKTYYEEDTLFNLKAFLSTKEIAFCEDTLYCWNKSSNSESSNIISHEENVNRQLFFLREMSDMLILHNVLSLYKKEMEILISDLLNILFPFYLSLPNDKMKILQKILKDCSFSIFGNYSDLKIISKKRMRLLIFVIGLYLKQF